MELVYSEDNSNKKELDLWFDTSDIEEEWIEHKTLDVEVIASKHFSFLKFEFDNLRKESIYIEYSFATFQTT